MFKKGRRKVHLYSKFDKQNFLFVYALIAIPVLQFIVFWFYVNINSIALAFQNREGAFTWNNFINVYKNFFQAKDPANSVPTYILRSFILWLVSNLLTFPIGLISTYVLYRRVCGHYAFRVIFSISGIVGAVVWISMLKFILNADGNGIVIYMLRNWFHVDLPAKALNDGLLGTNATAFPTIVIVGFISGIVGGSVIVTGAYTKVPPELMEAAKLDGLDFWGSFWHVALPCSWPTLSTIIVLSFCSIFTVEGSVYLYTNGMGSNGTATMGFYLYTLNLEISKNPVTADYYYPAALGLTISAITIPVVLLGRRIITKVIPTVEV